MSSEGHLPTIYLNNEARQPNADLAVTDNYGAVAFRVAQADAATIDAGIQGAAMPPNRWRGCRPIIATSAPALRRTVQARLRRASRQGLPGQLEARADRALLVR